MARAKYSKKPWFSIDSIKALHNGEQVNKAVIRIYGYIATSKWFDDEVSAASFIEDVESAIALYSPQSLEFRISSPGGSVLAGGTIADEIKALDLPTTGKIFSFAGSIATIICCAFDEVFISPTSTYMIHRPMGGAFGDIPEMQKAIEALRATETAMINAYMERLNVKGAMSEEELVTALDEETYYTAEEAVELGFVDGFIDDTRSDEEQEQSVSALAACAKFEKDRMPELFKRLTGFTPPSDDAIRQPNKGENEDMATKKPESVTTQKQTKDFTQDKDSTAPAQTVTTQAATAQAQAHQTHDLDAIRAQERQALAQRNRDITALFSGHVAHSTVMQECIADPEVSIDQAKDRLLDAISAANASANAAQQHRATSGIDEQDKFEEAAINALLARVNQAPVDNQNPLRGISLIGLMVECAVRGGMNPQSVPHDAGQRIEAVARFSGFKAEAPGLTTSNFPNLLENALHKMLVGGFTIQAYVWDTFAAIGSVNDFRPHNRYRMSSISNLEGYNQDGEFKYGNLADAEKEQQQASTKGKIIPLSRELLINDDLNALANLITALGRAAARSIETDFFTVLVSNPTLVNDGVALFDAAHGNVGSAGAITPSSLDEARQLMRQQQDAGANDYADITPYGILTPVSALAVARQTVNSEADPTSGNANSRKANIARNMVPSENIKDSPRLSGNGWYVFADPALEPVIEVAFLNGQREPQIVTMEHFNSAGLSYRVMHDWGVKAVGYRGAVLNAGA